MVNQLGAFSISFLTVLVVHDYRAGIGTAGLVSAAFGLATVPSRLLGGWLADRLGQRRAIVLGLGGCALAQLGIAAARSLAATAVLAVLLGLVFELYEPPCQAMIAEAVPPGQRVRAYGLLTAALAAGGMGAGLIAAALGRWDLRWLFVADAVSCLVCAVVLRVVLPEGRSGVARSDVASPVRVSPWRDPALLAMLASGTAFALVHLQIMMLLPLSLERRGLPASDAGLLFAVSAGTVVAAQPLLRLKRLAALPAPTALALGQLLLAVGLAGYAAATRLPVSLAATVVWSLGDLLVMGRAYAVVADLAPPGGAGRYLAVFGISWGIAGVAAPVLGTAVLERASVGALWVGLAGVCLLLTLAHLSVGRVRPVVPGRF
ncbi:MFS transporter [Streptacidiphilus carbonis]|uniref:MFS transporter n=1 Tax=Streptacidiphilus carbonis TaxID=105422 RepID=UPI000A8A184E|nr:MFS transporter [Streptacidiphilus carbonis]